MATSRLSTVGEFCWAKLSRISPLVEARFPFKRYELTQDLFAPFDAWAFMQSLDFIELCIQLGRPHPQDNRAFMIDLNVRSRLGLISKPLVRTPRQLNEDAALTLVVIRAFHVQHHGRSRKDRVLGWRVWLLSRAS
jgi:hypothetical protein